MRNYILRAGDSTKTEAITNAVRRNILNEGIYEFKSQQCPNTSYDFMEYFAQIQNGGGAGYEHVFFPSSYTADGWSDYATNHHFQLRTVQVRADKQKLEKTDAENYYGPPNMVSGVGDYELLVYTANGTPVTPSSIDYALGKIVLTGPGEAGPLYWTGYYYVDYIDYYKVGSNLMSMRPSDDYADSRTMGTLEALMLPNHNFELWDTSSQPTKYTITGTCARVASALQGTYACKLQGIAGVLTSLTQTLTLPGDIDQCTMLVLIKTDTQAQIKVSMGGSVYGSALTFTPSGTAQTGAYIWLAVESNVLTSDTVKIYISPQTNSAQNGNVWIEHIGLMIGALQ